jgi:Calcineurin-like phosphoesterase
MKLLVIAVAAFLSCGACAAPVDGPYVMRGTDGKLESWTIESADATVTRQVRPVAVGEQLVVPAVGSLPAFTVKLRKPAEVAAATVSLAAAVPLLVVADTHGEFEILADMLRAQRVVNERFGWSFGRGHLVVLGDVFDRGEHQLEILWLLYELEAQARAAGGGAHLLLGNHEVMVMSGDLRYMQPKYARTAQLSGVQSYAQLFDAGSVLGQWLRTRPTIMKVGGLLCLHGGVSRALVDRKLSLGDINESVRGALREPPPFDAAERERAQFLLNELGPLWYRGYFSRADVPAATMEDVDLTLAQFAVQRILVGHTIVPTVTPLYDGKVVAVQVYPGHDAAGRDHFEALLIENGKLLRALPDGSKQPL